MYVWRTPEVFLGKRWGKSLMCSASVQRSSDTRRPVRCPKRATSPSREGSYRYKSPEFVRSPKARKTALHPARSDRARCAEALGSWPSARSGPRCRLVLALGRPSCAGSWKTVRRSSPSRPSSPPCAAESRGRRARELVAVAPAPLPRLLRKQRFQAVGPADHYHAALDGD